LTEDRSIIVFHASVFLMPGFQPGCAERKELLQKATSAVREYMELKEKGDAVIGTEEYHALNESARLALHKAEMAV